MRGAGLHQLPPDPQFLLYLALPSGAGASRGWCCQSPTTTTAHRNKIVSPRQVTDSLRDLGVNYKAAPWGPCSPQEGKPVSGFHSQHPLHFVQCPNRPPLGHSALPICIHRLSCSIHVSIDKMDFPSGESGICRFVSVCSFISSSSMMPGIGISRNGEREPRHLAGGPLERALPCKGGLSLANAKAHGNPDTEATSVHRRAMSLHLSFIRSKHEENWLLQRRPGRFRWKSYEIAYRNSLPAGGSESPSALFESRASEREALACRGCCPFPDQPILPRWGQKRLCVA